MEAIEQDSKNVEINYLKKPLPNRMEIHLSISDYCLDLVVSLI